MEGLSIVVDLEVADSHIGKCQCVGGEVLNTLFVALDCLLIVPLVLVDVSEVIIGIAIPGVDLDGFFVPIYSLLSFAHAFVYNCNVVVSRVVLGVGSYAFLVVTECLIVLSFLIIGNSCGVVQLMDVLRKEVQVVVGFHVVF